MSRQDTCIFLNKWKDQVTDMVKLKYPNISDDRLEDLLDKMIKKNLNNRECVIANNYTHRISETNVLDTFEMIERNQVIVGGAGVLYVQHSSMENPITGFIADTMGKRSIAKKERDSFDFGSPEYKYKDRVQNTEKLKINSLYGSFGYFRFIMHNLFVAESVTSMGKNMITTATLAFEYFLSSNVLCVSPSEVLKYISNIQNEWVDNYMAFDDSFIPEVDNVALLKRLLSFCKFKYDQSFVDTLKEIIINMNPSIKKMVYYKNNLYEFCKIPFIRLKLKNIVYSLVDFKKPDLRIIPDEDLVDQINDFWRFLEYGVEYTYPVFDRVRKGSYSDRHCALYTDTDSNMVSVSKWVNFIKFEILGGDVSWIDEVDLEFNMVNLIAVYLTRLTTDTLMKMGDGMNITPEYAKLFSMKNEFYFRRMVFTDSKKRYLALKVLKEGKLLNGGKGTDEIKGFDFIKVNTKETLKEFYKHLSVEDILMAKEINKPYILQKVFNLKREIERSIDNGETIYFKQANVGIMEQYAEPYSIQGIKAVTLWNALNPDNPLQLPVDIDIVPTKLENPMYLDKSGNIVQGKLKDSSFMHEFKRKYPKAYKLLEKNIFNHPNEMVAKMGINVLAKPKNSNVELPEWYYDIIDKESIVETALNLINPVMNSLDFVIIPTTSNTNHLTNIVKL